MLIFSNYTLLEVNEAGKERVARLSTRASVESQCLQHGRVCAKQESTGPPDYRTQQEPGGTVRIRSLW